MVQTFLAFLCLALLAFAATAAQARSAPADATVKIRLAQDHWPVVPVWLANEGPFEFLLDTGTNVTMLSVDLAGRLGLRPIARVTVESVDGRRLVPYGRLPEVRVGPHRVQDVEIVLTDLPHLRTLGSRVSGILGQNVLSHFNFTLDYRKRHLAFPREGDTLPAGSHRLMARTDEGRLVIQGQVMRGGRALRLVLDSGVSRVLLRAGLLRPTELELSGDVGGVPAALTLSGSSALRAATVKHLALGHLTLSNVPAAILRGRSVFTGGAWDALLPTSLFDWIFFNNVDGFVVVQTTVSDYRRAIRLQRGPGADPR